MVKVVKKIIGVDVSSEKLSLNYFDLNHNEISKELINSKVEIARFLSKLSITDYSLAIEATGSYSSRIIHIGIEMGFDVYVANPLSIKRFGELHNFISKTDEQDARLIRNFHEKIELRPHRAKSEELIYLEQELDLWENLEEEKRRYKSKLKALEYNYKVNSATHKHYKSHIVRLEKEIKEVQKRIPQVGDEELKASVKLLTTIKGIGVKTALLLLTSTNGFKNFQSSKSLTKYFGVAPRLYQSGKKKLTLGKCRTSKNFVRSKLYVCAWSAVRSNKACMDLYTRMLANGKAKKSALIAVCGKLLRQAFAIIKNQTPYCAMAA